MQQERMLAEREWALAEVDAERVAAREELERVLEDKAELAAQVCAPPASVLGCFRFGLKCVPESFLRRVPVLLTCVPAMRVGCRALRDAPPHMSSATAALPFRV